MLSPLHILNDDLVLKILVTVPPKFLKKLYIYSRSYKAYLSTYKVINILSKYHELYNTPISFPHFYVLHNISYHPKISLVPSKIIRLIHLNNDDVNSFFRTTSYSVTHCSFLNIIKEIESFVLNVAKDTPLTSRSEKIQMKVDEIGYCLAKGTPQLLKRFHSDNKDRHFMSRIKPEHTSIIFKMLPNNFVELIGKAVVIYGVNYIYDAMCGQDCQFYKEIGKYLSYFSDELLKKRLLIIKSESSIIYLNILQGLLQEAASKDNINIIRYVSDSFVTDANDICNIHADDHCDICGVSGIRKKEIIQAVVNGCNLSSVKVINWLKSNNINLDKDTFNMCSSDNSLDDSFDSGEDNCICCLTDFLYDRNYDGSAIETLKESITLLNVEPEVFFNTVCIAEDIPSIIWLLHRGKITKDPMQLFSMLQSAELTLYTSRIVFTILYNYSQTGKISIAGAGQWSNDIRREYVRNLRNNVLVKLHLANPNETDSPFVCLPDLTDSNEKCLIS